MDRLGNNAGIAGGGIGATGALDERVYHCQNWRADTAALLTSTGKLVESVKHSAYGTALGLPAGDTDSDGDWDATDSGNITGAYELRKDTDLDGTVDATKDVAQANAAAGGYQTLGRGVLSSTGVRSRKGYAGYENDGAVPRFDHVRFRVLDTLLQRWLSRDPIEYSDGNNQNSPGRFNVNGLIGKCK